MSALVVAAGFLVTRPGHGAPPPADVVQLGGTLERADDGGATVRARVRVKPGYHVNAHRPGAEYLIPTELTLAAPGVRFAPPEYPDPVAREFPFTHGEKLLVYDGEFDIVARGDVPPRDPVEATLRYQACDERRCFPPATVEATLAFAGPAGDGSTGPAVARGEPAPRAAETRAAPANPAGGSGAGAPIPGAGEREPWLARWLEGASLPAALAMTLVLGLTLNLTPCVYPLVSVTVAYFGSQGRPGTRPWPLALAYVVGITLSFAVLGVSAALFGGLVGAPLQHPAVLIGLALLFVALAASSFGWFAIRAPGSLLERFGRASTGPGGALLMGLTSGVVAAPCIGPVLLGLLVFVGTRRDLVLGFLLFLSLGLGMGLPYLFLATAAGSLGRLPRSGEWLRWVNRLFGVILLGVALYFVAPLLSGDVVRVAVPLYVGLAGLYLGFLDPAGRALRGFRLARHGLGAAVIVAAGWLAAAGGDPSAQARDRIRWEPLSIPALDQAIAERRPTVVEFAADWCIPCLAMERTTFVDSEVTRQARRFAMLRADVTESTPANDALLGRFRVLGVPTFLFYDTRGAEVDRLVGFVDGPELATVMRRVAAGSDDPDEAEPPGTSPGSREEPLHMTGFRDQGGAARP